ncbi:MAG: hypothetical protein QE285_09930 [Aquabacterium sp.]|nr:hypothetical protein [Aquabacterium sp.]
MGTALQTIPIHDANPAHGCSGCLHSAGGGPLRRTAPGPDRSAPVLTGPADELARLLQALTPVLGALGARGLVQSLHVLDGEVTLQLAVHADGGGAALADRAFQTLRKLLPDTDIYVQLAR